MSADQQESSRLRAQIARLSAERDEALARVAELERQLIDDHAPLMALGLSWSQARFLALLTKRQIVRHETISYHLSRGEHHDVSDDTIKALVCYLRKRIARYDVGIESVYGVGYRLRDGDAEKIRAAIAALP